MFTISEYRILLSSQYHNYHNVSDVFSEQMFTISEYGILLSSDYNLKCNYHYSTFSEAVAQVTPQYRIPCGVEEIIESGTKMEGALNYWTVCDANQTAKQSTEPINILLFLDMCGRGIFILYEVSKCLISTAE